MFVSSFFIYVLALNLCYGENLIETQIKDVDHITTRGQDRLFSGFYYPKNIHSMESYGAAWLAPRERVVNRMDRLEMIGDLEGATREMIRFGKETNLMTRDYFDFHVIHLSGTTNGVHNESADAFLMREIYKKLSVTTQILMEHTIRQNYTGSVAGDSRLMDETVALIPFSVSSASNRYKFNRHQEAIRLEYFTATFWSVHRYMKHIIVTVGLKKDLALLTQLHLPVWRIIDLSQYYDPDIDRFNPASRWFLPRRSMLYVANRLQNLPFREEPCDYAKQHLAHERESIGKSIYNPITIY